MEAWVLLAERLCSVCRPGGSIDSRLRCEQGAARTGQRVVVRFGLVIETETGMLHKG